MQTAVAVKKPEATAVVTDYTPEAFNEYEQVAKAVGLQSPELMVARFKAFMAKHDLPIYDLKAVVAYMDDLAKRDNKTGLGWHWAPLREQDKHRNIQGFGQASRDPNNELSMLSMNIFLRRMYSLDEEEKPKKKEAPKVEPKPITPASDYWHSSVVYEKPVPLHALKRVAMIEREFGKKNIAFAVSDYATEPHIKPDPFLLAIIPSPKVGDGYGRFVIDVWDEPGFGILQMVKG